MDDRATALCRSGRIPLRCGTNYEQKSEVGGGYGRRTMEQFGKPRPDRITQDRPGAYGVAVAEGRLLVVEYQRRLHLPGGALAEGELPEEALRREVLEETGYEVVRGVPLAQAMQYVDSVDGYVNKICAFFAVEVGPRVRNYYSPGHSPEWVPLSDAVPAIAEEASMWAVQRYIDTHD
jgi:8-oxo-dGTP diphosphatase